MPYEEEGRLNPDQAEVAFQTSAMAGAHLDQVVAAQKRGQALGIYSVCSANPYVLRAAFRQATEDGAPALIESTSNQVNQFGGYTGWKPADFRRVVYGLAAEAGLEAGRVILGGDHLGPHPWRSEPAEIAIQKAAQMVADYVRAGYAKIHLDASMPLGGDARGGPTVESSAARAAALCQAAESAWREMGKEVPPPRYVIGSEVPPPGGEVPPPGGKTSAAAGLQTTTPESAAATLDATRAAFYRSGLEEAWERVIALVVQPGVDFGERSVHPYHREAAAGLARFIEAVPGLVYEAHSTDYQTPQALRALVEDHFAILKVGPALTFAFREAVFALEMIEKELFVGQAAVERSRLRQVLEEEMLRRPADWRPYASGTPEEVRLMRRYGLSDRVRYYWAQPRVAAALDRLIGNLERRAIPSALASQFFPEQVDFTAATPSPQELISARIRRVLRSYSRACQTIPD
jgi:D-tagatose-1,6-bisphosphate aldolase subunit GatZ/KbaZ